jgi:hypothetical protein
MKLISASVLAAASMFAGSAKATTYYVSDCQSGADAACVAGNDANAGTSASAPWQSITKVSGVLSTLAAGDQVLFARGGSWVNSFMNPTNLKATPTSPIVFDAFKPSWGAGTARPILTESRAGYNLFNFNDQGANVMDGGYTIRNLDLRGGGTGMWGIFLYNGVTNVTIDNVSITGFTIGMQINSDNAVAQNISITNSTIANNAQHGILGSGNNITIQGNTIAGNGFDIADFGAGFTHGIYLGGNGSNAIVRGNTFTDNTMYNGSCVAGPLVVHGQWNNVLIENNVMTQTAASPGCYGISVKPDYNTPEFMTNFVIRANTVVNMGSAAIALTSVPGIIVEDNVIINTQAQYQVGIVLPIKQRSSIDAADNAAIIRNNSIYFSQAGASSVGIQANSEGTNHQVVSNLIYFGAGSNSLHSCFTVGASSIYAAFSNNLCYSAGGNGTWSNSATTLALAQAAGFDASSLTANPLLVALPSSSNGWSMALQSTSPARDTGSTTYSSTVDKTLAARDAKPDVGAYEYRAVVDTVAPAPPSNVLLQ